MKERPILFSAPLVRAILADRKTQTRRLMAPQPNARTVTLHHTSTLRDGRAEFTARDSKGQAAFVFRDGKHSLRAEIACPYGAPGGRLWVREAWRSWFDDVCRHDDDDECTEHCHQTYVAYRATPRVGYRPEPDRAAITYLDESTPLERNPRLLGPWRPSIHMPRWASRITLEVTEVRVERLQDITEADALAEGVYECTIPADEYGPPRIGYTFGPDTGKNTIYPEPSQAFAAGWREINGADSWDANPWVWVVSFRRIEQIARAA